MNHLLSTSPVLFISLVGIISLMIGSFLNVVIYRLPMMLKRSWRAECLEYLELPKEPTETFNLSLPLSHCPCCKTPIKPYQNIPVFSYLFLKGRCGSCQQAISIRYPCIEALTALLSVIVANHFGYSVEAGFALLLTWLLVALSFIDIDHQLLPDNLTLPMVWLGLFLNLFDVYASIESSVIGAIAGYLSLWTVFHLFKLVTGKEGMGYGDFKLLAVFGAWLGWQSIPLIILLSSLVGAIIGISMIVLIKHDKNKPIPFGPYIAVAGWIALLWGNDINQLYLNTVGL